MGAISDLLALQGAAQDTRQEIESELDLVDAAERLHREVSPRLMRDVIGEVEFE
ncbi:MAG TPA: hypothetical protein VMW18_06105 [Candidatus Binatia bacterium]|nr:hypothetical protein [Candidatus Binatia bacterium]